MYLAGGSGSAPETLRALEIDRGALDRAAWPSELLRWRRTLDTIPPAPPGFPVLFASTVDAALPALIVHVPFAGALEGRAERAPAAVIVVLSREAIRTRLIDPLVARHFGFGGDADYFVRILNRADPADVVYASPAAPAMDVAAADVSVPLLALRPDNRGERDFAFFRRSGQERKERLAITIVRRAPPGDAHVVGAPDEGAWALLLRCRAGSLEALVARSRRRNIGISAGVLGLLAASFVLVALSAQRQQRLARQQMEFVAAVSHELRTPLAVICSAGENLADGVVADGAQVRQYGSLCRARGGALRT